MAITFYKDLPLDFTPHPVTGDIRPVTNDVAIRRSIRNLLLTSKGSKPFNPDYGSNIMNYLFTDMGGADLYSLQESLEETIKRHENRVTIQDIYVKQNNEGIEIKLEYIIKNVGKRDSLSTTVRRTA